MVYRRRQRRKRVTFRTRRQYIVRDGKRHMAPMRAISIPGVHFFKRTALLHIDMNPAVLGTTAFWTNSGVSGAGATSVFTLNDLPQNQEFSNLFDLYKICGVKMKFVFDKNDALSATGAGSSLPTLYFIRDQDDGTVPANINEMIQYESCKMKRLDKPCTFYVKPKISQMVYETAVTTAYATPKRNPWLDCANNDVAHYGCKWAIDFNTAFGTSIGRLAIFMTYYIACKDVR